MSHLK
jgi:hypothetical protein